MKLLSLLILIMFLMSTLGEGSEGYVKKIAVGNTTSQQEDLHLLEFLVEVGKTYNCFFTIEEGWQNGELMNQVETVRVSKAVLGTGLLSALNTLRNSAPNLTYLVSKQNPNIIHLIDVRLMRQGRYSMEAIVMDINFNGESGELVDRLGERGVPIQRPAFGDISEARRLKSDTKIKVVGKKLKVRDILCNLTTLEDHGQILWIARTKLGANEMTHLYLYR